jgi:hypothetical protein
VIPVHLLVCMNQGLRRVDLRCRYLNAKIRQFSKTSFNCKGPLRDQLLPNTD